MKLKLVREFFTPTETLGSLLIDGKFFCYTLEDVDRGLTQSMALADIKSKKVKAQTAIPYGKYKVELTLSNRFKKIMPLVVDVKGFEGIRFHGGNTHFDSEGCVLVAKQRNVNKVHPTIKKITNWIYGSTSDQFIAKIKGQKNVELEIVKKDG
jgi:hypothetical protein